MQEFERNYLNRIVAGKGALLLALLASLVMALVASALTDTTFPQHPEGCCLLPPAAWWKPGALSFCVNLLLVWITCLGAISLNKRFNFIPGSGVLYASLFLFAASATPWLDAYLTGGPIVACIVLACCHLLFKLYEKRNASAGIFYIFSILSWGSMIQYSCLLLIPIFMLGAIFLKVFRLKEFIASLLALAAPYWIIFGTGLVPLDALKMPSLQSLFTMPGLTPHTLLLLLPCAAISLGFLAMLVGSMLTTASLGVKMRAYNSFFNLLGIAMIWYMLFDAANIAAYATTLALAFGFQGGRFFLTSRLKKAYIAVAAIPAILIALYIITL